MTATLRRATDLDELAAIIEHAKQHDLIDTISSVGTGEHIVEPILYLSGVRGFVRWATSIGADQVEITETGFYFQARGKLTAGWEVALRIANYKADTAQGLEVAMGLRCSSCVQPLDGSEPTSKLGDLGEQIHDACAEPLVQTFMPGVIR